MSIMLEFAMFPTDKGESVSPYVGRIIDMIDRSSIPYQLTPMGTIIECNEMDEALGIVKKAYECLKHDCSRIYSSIKFDIRAGREGGLQSKIASIEREIGRDIKISKTD